MINEGTEFQIFLKSQSCTMQDNNMAYIKFDFSNRPIITDDVNDISIQVAQATIKYTWYNVNNYNNVLYINGKTVANITIPIGNYTSYSLYVYLIDILADLGYYLTWSSVTGFFSIVSDNPFYINASKTTANELLGYNLCNGNVSSVVSGSTYIIISDFQSDMTYTSNIYVCCPEFSNLSKDGFNINANSDIIASIPVVTNAQGIIFFEGKTRTTVHRQVVSNFDIILKDSQNRILPMYGGYWNITLDFKIINNNVNFELKKYINYIN